MYFYTYSFKEVLFDLRKITEKYFAFYFVKQLDSEECHAKSIKVPFRYTSYTFQ